MYQGERRRHGITVMSHESQSQSQRSSVIIYSVHTTIRQRQHRRYLHLEAVPLIMKESTSTMASSPTKMTSPTKMSPTNAGESKTTRHGPTKAKCQVLVANESTDSHSWLSLRRSNKCNFILLCERRVTSTVEAMTRIISAMPMTQESFKTRLSEVIEQVQLTLQGPNGVHSAEVVPGTLTENVNSRNMRMRSFSAVAIQ
jgi:hypothetical protein